MRRWFLDYLVCPACGGSITCHATEEAGDAVESGTLHCADCAATYPIVRGVPRMVSGSQSPVQARTAAAFGWQWLTFDRLHRDSTEYHARFLDWVAPLTPDYFRGKVMLDAGCGMGEFTSVAAQLDAKHVIGVDLSDSVEAAQTFAGSRPNVSIVQADLYNLPFSSPFDFVFSIGVIHHLPDPEGGVQAVSRHVKPTGTLFAWVYGYENNGWVRHLVTPFRERITTRLPRSALYFLSFGFALVLHPVLKALYKHSSPLRINPRLLPYHGYLSWLAQYGFRHTHCVIFDHLNAPSAVYVKQDELRGWVVNAGLHDVRLSWRNQNSWRAFGHRPA